MAMRSLFGQPTKRAIEAAIQAAAGTMIRAGIQSREGRDPKTAADEVAAADASGRVPSLAAVATAQEYGTEQFGGNIPERSYLRSTADARGKRWLKAFGNAVRAYATGDRARYTALVRGLGQIIVRDVRRTIRARIDPPLSDFTKSQRRKGGRPDAGDPVPLIDTGQLINSIRAEADTPDGTILLG